MSDISVLRPSRAGYGGFAWGLANRGPLISGALFLVLLTLVSLLSAAPLAYFDVQYISSGGLTLAIAAVGATIVILSGGFDLSVGAVISLTNVVVAAVISQSTGSQLLAFAAGIGTGALVGAVNGYFIAVLRLQSIVVTLATMFIAGGIALLIRSEPGGDIPYEFAMFFTGSLVEELIPASFAVLAVVILIWSLIRHSRFGTAIYAIGTDPEAAACSGISLRRTGVMVYVLAGAFYGLAGIMATALTSTSDPLVGNAMLLEVFTAVVLGGTLLGGGRGGCVGSILGAYSLMLIINILLVLNIPAFYATSVQALILIVAAISLNFGGSRDSLRWLRSCLPGGGRRARIDPARLTVAGPDIAKPGWLQRNRKTIGSCLPAFLVFLVIVALHAWLNGGIGGKYVSALLLLSSFLIILALGQGAVILTGGLDLSVGWTITFCGILLGQLSLGSDAALTWVLPVVLLTGLGIGAVNGFLIVFFRLPAIVVTLAMNGVLQSAALLITGGTPTGFAPETVRYFMTGSVFGVAPAVIFALVFAVMGYLLLSRTGFGRRIYASGNNARVAHLSGVNTGLISIAVYMLSGFCAAIVGVMLTGFSSRAILGMGDPYLLTSIAVVVIGGTLITGGRGNYIGMIGGVLLLVALQILLTSLMVQAAIRDIIFGLVIMSAVVAARRH